MNKKKHKGQLIYWLIELVVFFVVTVAFFIVLNTFILKPAGSELVVKDWKAVLRKKNFSYVAIGDSLTEGVGDRTEQGGFVPLLAKSLDETYNLKVATQNFGKAGDTSTQIYKRMTKTNQEAIDTALKKADLITITVGGNDVMKVIRDNISSLTDVSEASFVKPAKTYEKQMTAIFDAIRALNSTVPVYVIGIYNPFYLNFPEITQMQDIINEWNQSTETIVAKQENMFFVPVNDLLYQGIDGSQGITTSDGEKEIVINDALFEGDHFHPNNIGYQIMSDAVFEAYQKEQVKNEK
ncbi:hypothetical protein Hs30E_02930 [Lactococcus hodotermopsidis]|uniref:SGNH hydrolase-type esterase domain-containing protein n=1 Tax=Pseudolactococcus hodotermopsidis TaxID=2709157 RepID=A0A6A0B8S9_9LACT|nr:SGNH/GDSL hydrolase family protein [Lactococcus hodotermopsidis]GFH41742.1 hypothetical protein Hs30E_02930 [Lactococcus hodotermopsidis]